MNNPVIYIFLNKDLHMSVGKAAAQAVHAAMMANADLITPFQIDDWKKAVHRTVIILEGRDQDHILATAQYLYERQIHTKTIIDEGVNEIEPHTVTALATGILEKEDERTVKAMSTFKLYKEIARVTVEFER